MCPPYFAQKSLVFFFRRLRFHPVVIGFRACRRFQLVLVAMRRKTSKYQMVPRSVPYANPFQQETECLRYPHTLPRTGDGLGSHGSLYLQWCHCDRTTWRHPRHRSVFPLTGLRDCARREAVLAKNLPCRCATKTGSHAEGL